MFLYEYNFFITSLSLLFHRYNVQWYKAPLRAQKMILFILLRGNKSFTLNIAGMFVISLECFATVKMFACYKL